MRTDINQEHFYNTGNSHFFGEGIPVDKEAAFMWYAEAASMGHPAAQCNVGSMYRFGQGVEKNTALAEEWLMKAVAQGYRPARKSLAELYLNVLKDYELAYMWYEQLAQEGDMSAIYNLGIMFEEGLWVFKSHAAAEDCYRRAAAKGHPGAKLKLDKATRPV